MSLLHRAPAAMAAVLAVLTGTAAAYAATLQLQPGGDLAAVLRQAKDGDEIHIAAGDYRGQVAVIDHKRLTVRGVGGRPVFHADGHSAEAKAILVVRDGDIRIENIEFRGARVPDRNGAGIRFEKGRLTLQRCAFFDNEKGILTANFGDAELVIEDSQFGDAPAGAQLPHLIYVGRIARFTLTGSRVSGGEHGHLVKSRARENHIRYNALIDTPQGRAAYELEFPNGGLAYVVGNIIGQSRGTTNRAIVAFGAEGASDDRAQGLFMAHNTLINAGPWPAAFVRVHALPRPVQQRFVNNLRVGSGSGETAFLDTALGNFSAAPIDLVDAVNGPFGLIAGSALRGRGITPDAALTPSAQYTAPVGTRPLTPRARWSPGAIQD